MRQIEFRAWDARLSEWVYFDLDDLRTGQARKYQEANLLILKNWCEFTSLLDKNGKEIFEGDIVTDKNRSLGSVEYDSEEMAFKFRVNNGGWQHPLHSGFDFYTLEILGNIYQNPDLLTKGESGK